MMRRLIIALPIALVVAVAGIAGWHFLRPYDALAEARGLLAKGDVRAAQLVLRNAVQANPGRVETHVSLGQLEMRMGDPTSAEREFRAAAAHGGDPKAMAPLLAGAIVAQQRYADVLRDYSPDGLSPDQAANVLVARAQAQLGTGQQAQAAASVAQARLLVPKSAELAVASARVAIAANDPKAAATFLDQALAIDPHGLDALTLQAELRGSQGDQAGAVASYTAALALAGSAAPGTTERIRLARAVVLTAMGENARSRADIDAVLQTQPKQPVALFLSARLYAAAGDWKAADKALTAIGPLLDRLPDGDMALAAVKANVGEPEQAMSAAERQLARTPDNIVAVKLLARLQMAQHRANSAIDTLSTTKAPLDGDALELMSDAAAAAGEPAAALAALQKASALMPDDRRVLTKLAAMQLRQGEPTQAVAALRRALDAPQPSASGEGARQPSDAQTAASLVLASLRAGELDRAMMALDRLRAVKGDPAQIATLDGMVKLAKIDLAGARAAFEAAVQLNPSSWAAQLDLSRVLAMQGNPDEAIDRLTRVLATNPANPQVLTALTNLQLSTGRATEALATGEAAQRAAPKDQGMIAGLSALYVQTGHPDKALALLDAAPPPAAGTNVEPTLLGVRVEAEMALGHRSQAADTLRTLLDQTPDDVGLRRQLAEILAGEKQYDAARAVLSDGLRRRPGDLMLMDAAVALDARQSGSAAGLTRAQALAGDPTTPASVVLPGDLLMRQGKFSEAASAYQMPLSNLPKDDPRRGALVLRLAAAANAAGDPARAAGALRDWLAVHPDSPEMTLALASLDIAARRLPQARTALEALLAENPNNSDVLNNLAWVAQEQGDLPLAEKMASRAYLLGSIPQTADTLGWILLAQGRVEDATALLREAAKGRPNDPAIQYHLAVALAHGGQTQAAIMLLKTAVAMPEGDGFQEKPQATKLLADLAKP